ncbi:hypothetical protein [Silvimonas soli]|uniref:hypothetical protein n=1 Tax=Silvimonas soli TaxID=2980100 RepID=UPI0024B36BF6|nr:hypothetical protein [Silvimonas soli]
MSALRYVLTQAQKLDSLSASELSSLATNADTAIVNGLIGLQAIGDLAMSYPDDVGGDHSILTGLGFFLQDYANLLIDLRNIEINATELASRARPTPEA